MAASVCVNIQMLLEAAEYLERRERGESGYVYLPCVPSLSMERTHEAIVSHHTVYTAVYSMTYTPLISHTYI